MIYAHRQEGRARPKSSAQASSMDDGVHAKCAPSSATADLKSDSNYMNDRGGRS